MATEPLASNRVDQGVLAKLSDTCIEAQELAKFLNRSHSWLEERRKGALPWRYDGKLGPEDRATADAIKCDRTLSPSQREDELIELRAKAKAGAKREWKNKRALTLDWCDQVELYKAHRARIAALHPSDRAAAVKELMAAYLDPDPTKLAALEAESSRIISIRKEEAKERQIAGFLSRLVAAGWVPPSQLQLSRPFENVHFSRYAAQPIACLEAYRDRTARFWSDLYAELPELSDYDPQLVRRIVLSSELLASLAKEEVWQTRRAVRTGSLHGVEAA